MKLIKIADEKDLTEGKSLKFRFERAGKYVDGFLARFNGKVVAYENKCRHLPLSLDYGDNQFFTRDGKHFICQTHGALYEPLTGLCVGGPCHGESLKPVALEIKDGAVWIAP